MTSRAEAAAARRMRLQAQIASQRAAFAYECAPWRERLAVADRGIAAVRTAARHPLLLAGVVLLLVAWRPSRATRLLQYGWLAWGALRRLRGA